MEQKEARIEIQNTHQQSKEIQNGFQQNKETNGHSQEGSLIEKSLFDSVKERIALFFSAVKRMFRKAFYYIKNKFNPGETSEV